MHALKLLHKTFEKACLTMHKKRFVSLCDTVCSLFNHAKLSGASLGRHMHGSIKVKNKIKKVDRLLGNVNLNQERKILYQHMAYLLIGTVYQPVIAIDWSPCPDNDNQILRASLLIESKALELYSEVYPISRLGKYHIHKQFMHRLKKIVPETCKPIILTDGGFRTEWFKLVSSLGWDFIGRIRIKMVYQKMESSNWQCCQSLYAKASSTARYIGEVLLTKTNKLNCHLHLYKQKPKYTRKNKRRQHGPMVELYRKTAKTPWLLATSLQTKQAKKIVRHYEGRMKIEHDFRDTKDPQWGIGLHYTRCHNMKRLENLLLIGAMARFILWLIGVVAEQKQLHYDFQANTVKKHRVLSLVYLGLQIVHHYTCSLFFKDVVKFSQQKGGLV